jgi:hypothetical protein
MVFCWTTLITNGLYKSQLGIHGLTCGFILNYNDTNGLYNITTNTHGFKWFYVEL